MERRKLHGIASALIVASAAIAARGEVYGQVPGANGSWLSNPMTNWNKPGATIPQPTATENDPSITASCGEQFRQPESAADHALKMIENTYWKLVELNGRPITTSPNRPEAHFQLDSRKKRLQGNSGCNIISGGYELSGDRITFTRIISTRMACHEGMEIEQEFLKALEASNNLKLAGENLELYGDDKLLARFEAGKPR
jgi:heat shock protein HslJ